MRLTDANHCFALHHFIYKRIQLMAFNGLESHWLNFIEDLL
mgnify:CR=1 FL=1